MMSLEQFYYQTYKIKLTQVKQPLLEVKIAKKICFLPPEFCLIDGVPEQIKKGAGMRKVLDATRLNPSEKIHKVNSMI